MTRVPCRCSANKNCFSIVDCAPNKLQLMLKEVIYIKWESSTSNKQLKPADFSLFLISFFYVFTYIFLYLVPVSFIFYISFFIYYNHCSYFYSHCILNKLGAREELRRAGPVRYWPDALRSSR